MSKLMIIMRGVPGSGKTTKAKTYGGVICSADHYFMKKGQYNFDRTKLGQAHADCRKHCYEAMMSCTPIIVIDNTNTTKREYSGYVEMAKLYGYEVVIDDLYNGGLSAKQLAERNIHSCPEENIQRMIDRYQRS